MKTALVTVALMLALSACSFGGTDKAPGGIEFTYYDPAAYSVSAVGSFNDWDMRANPMTKDDEGTWRLVLPLAPGRYEYKFVVNGADWLADPDNPNIVGDYGNSEIEIDNEGNPVATGMVERVSNTVANARVNINGWFRGTYTTRKDVLGDVRWRLARPSHEMYLSFNPTLGSDVKGSGTIRIDTGRDDIREVTADLYAGWLKYKSARFDITAYHNEEIAAFDNPMGIVGHLDLPGTPGDDALDYGRGTQGMIGDFRVGGFAIRALYSNAYDYDIYNSGTRWVYNPDSLMLVLRERYDNVGTDVLAVRAKRTVFGLDWGGTFVSKRDGWWVGFEQQEMSEALAEYRRTSGDDRSFWFEMGTSDMFIGGDIGFSPVPWLAVFGEYAVTSYEAKWDGGNQVRKQADTFVDGEIDVPVGDEDGTRYKAGFGAMLGGIDLDLTYERLDFDGMAADEVYVTNQQLPFEDPDTPLMWLYGLPFRDQFAYVNAYTGVFNIDDFSIYEHLPLPQRKADVIKFDLGTKLVWNLLGLDFDEEVGLEVDVAKHEWVYPQGLLENSDLTWVMYSFRDKGTAFGDRLGYDLLYEVTRDNISGRMPSVYDKEELLLRADFSLTEKWSIYGDLRGAGYSWTDDDKAEDETFFNPYLALVWSPIPQVEIRLGYGLNPYYYRDTPVEGRQIGRERWMASDLWLNPLLTLTEAEEDLEDVKMISLMGVIAF